MSLEQLDRCVEGFIAMASGWSAETSLPAMRLDLEALFAGYPELPAVKISHIALGVPAEQVAAPEAANDRAVLCLHGGGFSMGSARAHRSFAGYLSRAAGAQVVTIDYRLVPEHIFPAALDDAVAAYRHLIGQGFAPNRIALEGDSAGGGLAVATLMRLRDAGENLPACCILLSPWLDMRCRSESYVRNGSVDPVANHDFAKGMGLAYVGPDGDLDHPLASPLLADLKGLPPIMVQLGTRELFIDEAIKLAERVKSAEGVALVDLWPCMIHQFQLHAARLDEARQAIDRLGAFIKRHTGPEALLSRNPATF